MIKRISIIVVSLLTLLIVITYGILRASLPSLDQHINAPVSANLALQRDAMGRVIINANNRADAAFAMGYAHAQDRLFQMDLLRRSGAGEISELFGKATLDMDKRARFHQFRRRAQNIFAELPDHHKTLLERYSQGVNQAVESTTVLPFEYLFLQASFKPWLPEDSLLTSFSMYMDLQHSQVLRDLTFTRIREKFGQPMVDLLLMPSDYQAALDGSITPPLLNLDLPQIAPNDNPDWARVSIHEPIDIGSNNWAVNGAVTNTGHAMLSDDMHLGLRVPPVWYRASINYKVDQQDIVLNGVSLPGSPGIIVGTNGHVAWGFTNANLDNTDWIELAVDTPTTSVIETIMVKQTEYAYEIEQSQFGPVKQFDDKRYALKWVAHYPYGLNLDIVDMDAVTSVKQAISVAHGIGIPVQNMVVADTQGNIAWTPAGGLTARPTPSNSAISEDQVSELWTIQEPAIPDYTNPENNRIWTANARVISAQQLERFGDGGYALGARGLQIRDRLFEYDVFEESDFYTIQLDNEAWFLGKWHNLLTTVLSNSPSEFSLDLSMLDKWQSCACADSVGYSLVRKFRSQIFNQLLAPLENHLQSEGLSMRTVIRHAEPAIAEILKQQPLEWLPEGYDNWDQFLQQSYRDTRTEMLTKFVAEDAEVNLENLQRLRWGNVNALKVQHPFSMVMPWLSGLLDMPTTDGFGDSFMPAVQSGSHGASQRLVIQPGYEKSAILTIPGGQSGHPLSPFYRLGFDQYINNTPTPLLPGDVEHTIHIHPN